MFQIKYFENHIEAASFALLFELPRDWFSGLRGGKLNLPIFCVVTAAYSRLSSDILLLLLDEELASSLPHATGSSCSEVFWGHSVWFSMSMLLVASGSVAFTLSGL